MFESNSSQRCLREGLGVRKLVLDATLKMLVDEVMGCWVVDGETDASGSLRSQLDRRGTSTMSASSSASGVK